MRFLHPLIVLGTLLPLGCGGASRFSMEAPQSGETATRTQGGAGQDPAAPPVRQDAPVARKIIYTARVELIVEDFDVALKTLMQLVEQQKGYVANSEVRGAPGKPRFGTWTLRIPVANFKTFLTALEELGEPQRNTTDSQDVTDEYYDLEARIKNKKVEEERLLEHLKKTTGKLEDILAVERELSRVRGEIEQAQGRFQKLTKLTELTTVTVSFTARKDYVPPASPSFGTSIGRTFEGSLDMLLDFGRGFILVVVALVPWLPVLALIAVPSWLLVRRYRSRHPRLQPIVQAVNPVEPLAEEEDG